MKSGRSKGSSFCDDDNDDDDGDDDHGVHLLIE